MVAWALLNEAIADEALQLFGDRYLLVRIEDIALIDPLETITKLLLFLDIPLNTNQLKEASQMISKRIRGKHAAAYGGAKHGSEEVRNKLIVRLQPALEEAFNQGERNDDKVDLTPDSHYGPGSGDVVLHALRRFGYRTQSWGLKYKRSQD
mmetsp:Transcript_25821/g.33608  ORF Transcript_25821/g.33608 Transcript_25821/m.33608 type:complete len:151 (-) Transcript_25821:147-599(-)